MRDVKNFPRIRGLRSGAWTLAAVGTIVGLGAVPVPVTREAMLVVHARPILIEDETTSDLPELRLDVPPSETARTSIALPADRGPDMPARIRLEVEGDPSLADAPHRVTLRATWPSEGGASASAERTIEIREGTTGFFEAAHGPGWRLTLAVRAERTERIVARPPRTPELPVVFRVEVGRLVAGDYVALETNDLSTFRGEPVEYSFRLGRDETLEDLRLVLTPVRIEGEVVEIRVEIAGSLHRGRETPVLLSRRETWITDKKTTSEITAAVGEPPDGFRFRVTPVW